MKRKRTFTYSIKGIKGLTKREVINAYFAYGIEARYSGKTRCFYLYK